ncbi:MAG: hypothetical protein Q7V58_11185 [Actinomycetota bacterium]|nr:hypothetical protein [Actinomycetota bacterium]
MNDYPNGAGTGGLEVPEIGEGYCDVQRMPIQRSGVSTRRLAFRRAVALSWHVAEEWKLEERPHLKPHSLSDFYLAPVALAVDARLEELGALTAGGLANRVALVSDIPDSTAELRVEGLLRTVGQNLELHEWTLAWHPRGIRLSCGTHHFVLGVPEALRAFVN